ncbi:monooxygenase 2 [Papaver somniferum]|uniref:monooxygenase 2 n=1 Tax=Papaver somniferum TaxID=3469 RepID=UPI000E7056BB|nr:monooxygenase 2 [Papaver somniferum]
MKGRVESTDIVIVGAGIAGLSTSLGLHRLGLGSLVLETSDCLRVTGFAFLTWANGWKALDALGIADALRQQHELLEGLVAISTITGRPTSEILFTNGTGGGRHEVRSVGRKLLLETLANELPHGTIRFNSKVVLIEEDGHSKLIHLADGSVIKTKVLIGCDGVNSVVAKWLGLQEATFIGRATIRGLASFEEGEDHHFGSSFLQLFGKGCRSGFVPCNKKTVHWFFQYNSATLPEEEEPSKLKQYVLDNLGEKAPKEVIDVVKKTNLGSIISSPLRTRMPWKVYFGNIYRNNVCVAGDALHPMTPDIGQGACAALEDGIILARCLGQALLSLSRNPTSKSVFKDEVISDREEEELYYRVEEGLGKFARERRWRSLDLITTAYYMGSIQQGSGRLINYVRDNFLSSYLTRVLLRRTEFDCGEL